MTFYTKAASSNQETIMGIASELLIEILGTEDLLGTMELNIREGNRALYSNIKDCH